MIIVLELIVVAVAILLVAAPLLRAEPEAEGVALNYVTDALEREKESVFTTLGEIEFDYQMRKLEKEDYEALRRKYRSQAVSILKDEEKEDYQSFDVSVDNENLEDEVAREIEKEIEKELEIFKGNQNAVKSRGTE